MNIKLRDQYIKLAGFYVEEYCKKHQTIFNSWSNNEIGTVAIFDDQVMLYDDIRYDIDNDIAIGIAEKYATELLIGYAAQKKFISFRSYLEEFKINDPK